ncbi:MULTISPECIES: hypothetical protein [unclassified Clostridioides]|nr:hypothetical protein [Clostridioides sp. ZZV14-6150]MCC0660479.1 hypothetical protein [Clostridioides sp. ZZV14-6154]MCC0718817.1 hypothetical protein [Clostridioides sp. ZZV14-6105]MCC0723325.1 hypothetical protein [Clostridioides sp. ZZV14-6104]MCC0726579.1 hypothetical protein [Clostridioides sp. ZZV14-6045]MCC0730593.1 hypothetical protein [Clostridioides sp. ZZV14-6048]MCC0739204.1 hypothetical protein [Clostridioides sp. ZZV14-5902]MCC0742742.1 hypothetical protein [Clostridioides s
MEKILYKKEKILYFENGGEIAIKQKNKKVFEKLLKSIRKSYKIKLSCGTEINTRDKKSP